MTKTGLAEPENWEDQLRHMLGPDADGMIKTFNEILEQHEAEQDEPAGIVAVAVSPSEAEQWLVQTFRYLDTGEYDPQTLKDILWNVGLQLSEIYMGCDNIAPDDALNEAYRYFNDISEPDDWDDDEDED